MKATSAARSSCSATARIGPIGFGRTSSSQAQVIDRARADDVMIYAIGLRSRRRQSMSPGLGPSGLRAAMLDDLPDPGLARVAEETGGGYMEIRPGDDLRKRSGRWPTSCTASTCSASRHRAAMARCTRWMCASRPKG